MEHISPSLGNGLSMESLDSSIMLTGAPATGKSTVMRELLQEHGYTPSPDITTRPIRPGEVDGADKTFVTIDAFKDLYNNGRLIEPTLEYCNYQGNYYGSPTEWLDGNELGSSRVLTCVAAMIAKQVRKQNKNILWVHLESADSDRADRLAVRGISKAAIAKRLDNSGGDSHLRPAGIDLSINTSRLTLPQTINHILEAI